MFQSYNAFDESKDTHQENIDEFPAERLAEVLRKICVEIKLHTGKHFPSYATKFFVPANEALDSHLKSLAKTGVLSSTKHKQALDREDV